MKAAERGANKGDSSSAHNSQVKILLTKIIKKIIQSVLFYVDVVGLSSQKTLQFILTSMLPLHCLEDIITVLLFATFALFCC